MSTRQALNQLLSAALSLVRAAESGEGKAIDLTDIAVTYLKSGQTDKCVKVLEEAIGIESHLEDGYKSSRLAWIAGVYYQTSDVERSECVFREAIDLARSRETPTKKCTSLYRVAREYVESGQNEKAATILLEMTQVVVGFESPDDRVDRLVDIADNYNALNLAEMATGLLEQARSEAMNMIPTKANDLRWSDRLVNVAEVYISMGRQKEATELLETAAVVIGKKDCAICRWYAWMRIAEVYECAKQTQAAANILCKAVDTADKEGGMLRSDWLAQVACKYVEYGNLEVALEILWPVMGNVRDEVDSQDKVSVLIQIARAFAKAGVADGALGATEEALKVCESLEDMNFATMKLGEIACLFIRLTQRSRAEAVVSEIEIKNASLKGDDHCLDSVACEFAEINEFALALRILLLARNSQAKSGALRKVSEMLASGGLEIDSETEALVATVTR